MASVFREGKRPKVTYGVSFHSLRDNRRFWHRLGADALAAHAMRDRIELLKNRRVSGEPIGADLAIWLDRLPESLRNKLAEAGLVEGMRAAAAKSINQHLIDFAASLKAKGTTDKRIAQTHDRAAGVFQAANIKILSEITASKVGNAIQAISQKRKRKLNSRTAAFYLASVKQFCRWAMVDGRLHASPIEHLKIKLVGDFVRRRRPLSVEELAALVRFTIQAPDRKNIPGFERALLYAFAVESGCRAGEIAALTVGDFESEENAYRITIRSHIAKNRTERSVLLSVNLSMLLAQYFRGKMPAVSAFTMPRLDDLADMLRRDLADARTQYLQQATNSKQRQQREQDGFLRSPDLAGRVVDFHALRVTSASLMVASGINVAIAQQRLGHRDPKLTLRVYTMTYRKGERESLSRMPDLTAGFQRSVPKESATGTDDVVADQCDLLSPVAQHQAQHARTISIHSGSLSCVSKNGNPQNTNNTKSLEIGNKTIIRHADSSSYTNATGAIRTHDLRFRKPLLYPAELRPRLDY